MARGKVSAAQWRVVAAAPPEGAPPATLVTAELAYDGVYLGEKAECYVTVR
jgi:hypothetical protein